MTVAVSPPSWRADASTARRKPSPMLVLATAKTGSVEGVGEALGAEDAEGVEGVEG